MKKVNFLIFNFMLILTVFYAGCSTPGSSNGITAAQVDAEVKAVFDAVNDFRTGSEAYYWESDNSTIVNMVGKLGKLTLDENLCRAAKIRAAETVSKFEHTRPDGRSCLSVLDDLGITYYTAGENLAAGNKTGSKTFLQWKEDNKNYAEQGHRRNMLNKDFTRIGIAYVYDASSVYKYYWVMVLAK